MAAAVSPLARQAQEIRAQSLSSVIANVEAVGGAGAAGGASVGTGSAGSGLAAALANAGAAPLSPEAAIRAVIIEAQANGRIVMQVAGALIETELPPDLRRAAAANPELLRPGALLTLPASHPVKLLPSPATLVTLTGAAAGMPAGPSVGPAPPLANPFPAGTLGAIIARIAGMAFPQGEPAASRTAAAGATLATPPANGFRPGTLAQPMPPEIAEALLRAASRQMPLAPAMTALLGATQRAEAQGVPLPPALAAALAALQGARPTPETLARPAALREAVAKSGVFLEANLAQAATTAALPAGMTPGVPQDMKALLLAIRALLGGDPEIATPKPGAETPGARANLQGREGAEPRAQGHQANQPLPELARAAEGALERVKLMQLASLPDHPELRVTDDRAQTMRLALSIPLAIHGPDRPQTAMMGVVIEHQPLADEIVKHDAAEPGETEAEAFPWKLRLALDLEETGPVQAEIALRGQSIAVTLWAERRAIATRARDEIGALHEALTNAAFDVTRLDVRDGRPLGQTPRSGPVVDRLT
jgi:hypothetical protein